MILIFTNGVYLTSHNRFYDNEHVSDTLARKINSEYDSEGYLIMKKLKNFLKVKNPMARMKIINKN